MPRAKPPSPVVIEMREVLLFPCNGNAVEALDCLGDEFRAIGFVDDDPGKVGAQMLGLPVRDRAAITDHPRAGILAVPGSPMSFSRRAALISSLGVPRDRFATIVHPSAVVSRHARLGVNVLIMAGTVVTANAVIGDHAVVLPNSVIHHDSWIGAYSVLGSGVIVAGFVQIGANCYIGSGSRIRDHVTIAAGTLIGLGSTVLRSIDEPGGVWAGNPARFMRSPMVAECPTTDTSPTSRRPG
jgi:sugar O-acyltransferase (sialic acid O-acetyltransferase NeuD family)